jgi:hypothetical protein
MALPGVLRRPSLRRCCARQHRQGKDSGENPLGHIVPFVYS